MAHKAGVKSNVVFMHVDPHAIAFTPDFEITLKRSTQASPFDKNSELDQHVAGRLWLANDGGVYWCDDGGRKESSWQMPPGLETLDAINIAGLFGIGSQPALYMGCGDNNDFFSRDGGQHWGDPGSGCGDCDAWVADMAQADRVVQFLPRRQPSDQSPKGFFGIVRSDGSEYPNAGDDDNKRFAPSPKKMNFVDPTKLSPYAASDVYLLGYRPLILTLATELPLPDGDLIVIEQALDGTAFLFRTTAISVDHRRSTIGTTRRRRNRSGPQLPTWRDHPAGQRRSRRSRVLRRRAIWRACVQVEPGQDVVGSDRAGTPRSQTPVKAALRWFVDPYEPNTIYVLDADGVKVSVDGGRRWDFDARFTRVITADGQLTISASLLQDMLFMRGERQTRFAFGTAGVFWTENFGVGVVPDPELHRPAWPSRVRVLRSAVEPVGSRAVRRMRGTEHPADRRDPGSATVPAAAPVRLSWSSRRWSTEPAGRRVVQWIEQLFGVSPDLGSGTVEMALLLGALSCLAWLVSRRLSASALRAPSLCRARLPIA